MSIFTGISQLLQSPSGVFALLCLAILAALSWHLGIGWMSAAAAAWTAFFTIVPTALGYFEHKETLKQMDQPPPPQLPNERGRL